MYEPGRIRHTGQRSTSDANLMSVQLMNLTQEQHYELLPSSKQIIRNYLQVQSCFKCGTCLKSRIVANTLWHAAISFDSGLSVQADVKLFGINLNKHCIRMLLVCWSVLHAFHVQYFYHSINHIHRRVRISPVLIPYSDQGQPGTCANATSLRF